MRHSVIFQNLSQCRCNIDNSKTLHVPCQRISLKTNGLINNVQTIFPKYNFVTYIAYLHKNTVVDTISSCN